MRQSGCLLLACGDLQSTRKELIKILQGLLQSATSSSSLLCLPALFMASMACAVQALNKLSCKLGDVLMVRCWHEGPVGVIMEAVQYP